MECTHIIYYLQQHAIIDHTRSAKTATTTTASYRLDLKIQAAVLVSRQSLITEIKSVILNIPSGFALSLIEDCFHQVCPLRDGLTSTKPLLSSLFPSSLSASTHTLTLHLSNHPQCSTVARPLMTESSSCLCTCAL